MTKHIENFKRRLDADRVAARIVRWGLLAIVGLLLLLVAFYAIDRWYVPEMPAGDSATAVQKGVYALLGGGLLAALTVTAIAASINALNMENNT